MVNALESCLHRRRRRQRRHRRRRRRRRPRFHTFCFLSITLEGCINFGQSLQKG